MISLTKKQYLLTDEPLGKTKSFIVGNTKVQAPCYMPETKSPEDLEALLYVPKALDAGNPIIVPSHKWMQMATNPRFQVPDLVTGRIDILQYVKEHPVIFYEPPELFRYTYPKEIVSYAMKGNITKIKKFYSALRMGDSEKALEQVSEFFRPFIRRQIGAICKAKDIEVPEGAPTKYEVEKAWLDEGVVEGAYFTHVVNIVTDAISMPSASIIPTVPPLTRGTVDSPTILKRINSTNAITSMICDRMAGKRDNPVDSYYHVYVDTSALDYDGGITALKLLEDGLSQNEYCGVAITIHGYDEDGKLGRIESFVNDVVNIAQSQTLPLPVIMPRSGWYGLYLADYGIQGFSSLLNGKTRYTNGGGLRDPDDRFGVVPIIDQCVELKIADVRSYFKKYGEFPRVANLPTKINPNLLDSPEDYRMYFAKPMRLIHAEEARRIRAGQLKDVRNPAKRYLSRSIHDRLKGA